MPRKELASLVGKLAFASYAVECGHLYVSPLYSALHRHVEHLTLSQRMHMRGHTTLDPDVRETLEWWAAALPTAPGRRFHVHRGVRDLEHVWGDASSAGRGATWYGPDGPISFSRAWGDEMRAASSNLRELSTLLDCVQLWGDQWLAGSRVLYTTDNSTTAACVNRGYGRRDEGGRLSAVTKRLHLWAAQRAVSLQSRWAPGTAIIAEGSDALSREDRFAPRPSVPWRLAPAVGEQWAHMLGGAPSLPLFQEAGDALRSALRAQAAGTAHAAVTLILPDWPSAAWFAHLRRTHVLYRYPAGAACLRHPDNLTTPVRSRHPLLVVHIPASVSDAPPMLTKGQRRAVAWTAHP